MRYTILGSTGFIGTNLRMHLERQSFECFLPAKDYVFSKKENLGHVVYSIGLTADFRKRPMDTIKAHVCKLIEVLENSSFESFLYLSSARIYRENASGDETAIFSIDPSDFSDIYNISKIMGEAGCLSIPNEKVRIVRLSNVVGNDFNSDNFLFSLIKDAVDKHQIELNISPDAAKDYISIKDVVGLIQLIVEQGRSRIYNISTGQSLSNRQLTDEIKKHTNCKVSFLHSDNGMSFPLISNDRIKKEFSYIPQNILPEIKSLIQKYKQMQHD
jgi:nucleoside-diphosphate-sugar epimerase